jgi:sulfur-carrier protein adenylyltransferase/sulfurtransferase
LHQWDSRIAVDPEFLEQSRCVEENDRENMDNHLSEISVQQLKARMEAGENILLLDVREPYEFKIANLSGQLVPLGQLHSKFSEIDRSREIVVYCHHGNRSAIAVQFLKNQGFEKVLNLAGGIEQWSREIDPSVTRY